jgi:hypothetical protein
MEIQTLNKGEESKEHLVNVRDDAQLHVIGILNRHCHRWWKHKQEA